MARPKKDVVLNWTQLESLCAIPNGFLTQDGIVDILNSGKVKAETLSKSSIQRMIKQKYGISFDQFRAQKQVGIKAKLAGKQIEVALKGSVPMLIWLGKQHLGQMDQPEPPDEAEVEYYTRPESMRD